MTAISVDVAAVSARDHAELYTAKGDKDYGDATQVIVDVTLEDDDQVSVAWSTGKTRTVIWMPADRLRRLLTEAKGQE